MTDAEFEVYIQSANDELRQKQQVLKSEFGLGQAGHWWFDQGSATLQFFDDENRLTAEAEAVPVGSYSSKSSTWRWAWSNESILPSLRRSVLRLTELETFTGMPLFAAPHAFKVDGEPMAWELTAMSVKFLDAIGSYRAPSDNDGPTTFLAIMTIRKSTLQ